MTQLSRRRFITRGSVGFALAGALAAVPGLGSVLKLRPASAPIDPSSSAEPLIAHVRDLSSGEMSLFVGTNQVIHRDADLAARLYNAVQGKEK